MLLCLLLHYCDSAWSMGNKLSNCKSSKKVYKIKRKFTFFSKYQIYFILWVENIEIFIRAAHSWKFWCFQHTRWNIFGIHLKKVNILYVYCKFSLFLKNLFFSRLFWLLAQQRFIAAWALARLHLTGLYWLRLSFINLHLYIFIVVLVCFWHIYIQFCRGVGGAP